MRTDRSRSTGRQRPPTAAEIRRSLETLPTDWRLARVGRNKAPIGGDDWFDVDNYSPDDALALNGSGPPAWGLKSGPASGVIVLDGDAEGWRDDFRRITGHPVDDLPLTITWSSGKPGRAGFAFAVPDGDEWWPALANRRAFKNDAGRVAFELRGNRHQSVIVGRHPETGRYDWLPGCSPVDLGDPAPAPAWLLEALLVQEHPDAEPVAPTAEDAARAVRMLAFLKPEEFEGYEAWLPVGMALHHVDPGLLSAWVDWSRGMSDFDEAECLRKWASFGKSHKGRPVTLGTLHYLASQRGYREAKQNRRRSPASGGPVPQQQAPGRRGDGSPDGQDEAQPEQAPEPRRRGEDTPEQKLARVREIATELLEARTPYGDRVPLLRHKAADLGLQLRDGEILRLFVEARRTGTPEAVEAGEVVRGETAPWLVEGLFLAGTLNLIVAPPKVGKTTLVLGMIATWRQRRATFIGQPLSRAEVPPVLIVGTDQPEADWCKGLRDFGLLDASDRLAHPITALYHRGRPIHLDDEGVERIAMRAAEREGLLILCDSLSALTAPLGIREETPEIAAPVQALMEAVTPYGATVVLIHHANKSRLDRTGVASSRGSTALPAMASQIVNLAWASGDESDDDRRVRLTTAGRAGADLDLLIERDGNEWTCLGSGAEVAAERRRAEEERKLNDRQDDVLEIVRERWNEKQERTTAQHVVEALRLGGADPSRIARRTLKQLETRGLLESIARSTTAASIVEFWPKSVRPPGLSPNPVRTVRTVRTSPPSHVDSDEVLIPNPFPPKGSDRFGQFGQAGGGGGGSDTLSGHPPEGSDTLGLETEWESPDRIADTQRERRIRANPAAVEQADADRIWELHHARRTAQQVDPFVPVIGGGDDPAWGPRPDAVA